MSKKTTKNTPLSDQNNEGVYFTELKITDLKCFHGENTINLTTKNGNFAQWTVILGNNNTGKTTILKSLAGFEMRWLPVTGEKDNLFLTTSGYFPFLDKKFSVTSSITNLELQPYYSIAFNTVDDTFLYKWHLTTNIQEITDQLEQFKIYAYSTSRNIQDTETETTTGNTDNLLENTPLMNCEKWLKELYLSEKLGNENAGKALAKIKILLTSGILPDVQDFTIKSIPKGNTGVDNFIEFTTDYGAVRFRELGYGRLR